mgnify:CR=1 FL=1
MDDTEIDDVPPSVHHMPGADHHSITGIITRPEQCIILGGDVIVRGRRQGEGRAASQMRATEPLALPWLPTRAGYRLRRLGKPSMRFRYQLGAVGLGAEGVERVAGPGLESLLVEADLAVLDDDCACSTLTGP